MKDQLLEQFFNNPMKQFGVRELGRLAKLDTKTVMKYLKELAKERTIFKNTKKGSFPAYEANRASLLYRHEKSEYVVRKILESGLIEYIESECHPKAVVLFGSVQKGTYHKKSDIDIFVQGKEKRLNLDSFETKIDYPIQLLFEENLKELSKVLLGNIYNGSVLSGRLEVL